MVARATKRRVTSGSKADSSRASNSPLETAVFAGRLTETRILWIIRLGIGFGLTVLIGYTADIAIGEWYTLFIIPALLATAGY